MLARRSLLSPRRKSNLLARCRNKAVNVFSDCGERICTEKIMIELHSRRQTSFRRPLAKKTDSCRRKYWNLSKRFNLWSNSGGNLADRKVHYCKSWSHPECRSYIKVLKESLVPILVAHDSFQRDCTHCHALRKTMSFRKSQLFSWPTDLLSLQVERSLNLCDPNWL